MNGSRSFLIPASLTLGLCVLGVVACSEIQRPRVDEVPPKYKSGAPAAKEAESSRAASSELLLAQYPALREDLRRALPFLSDQDLIRAHEDSLGLSALPAEVNLDHHLRTHLEKQGWREADSVAQLTLMSFFRGVIRAIDPFSVIHSRRPTRRARLDLKLPTGEWATLKNSILPLSVGSADRVFWMEWRKWEGSGLGEAKALLRSIATRPGIRAVVLDFRSAAGLDYTALKSVEDAASALASARIAVVIWVDRATRGTPEAAAQIFKQTADALIVGEPSFGYVRTPCYQTLQKWTVAMGCECPASYARSAIPVLELPVTPETLTEMERLKALGVRPSVLPAPCAGSETSIDTRWNRVRERFGPRVASPTQTDMIELARIWSEEQGSGL